MTLDYKILWFEDEEGWYEAILKDISEYLSDNGFTLIPNRKDNSQDISNIFEEDDYDLILIDYNLLGEKGDVIIKKIRQLDVFTDIVFYSQSGEVVVRNSIKDQGLDGVYCSDREQNEFIEKVKRIINTTIKKVVDVNNMRGIVIAKTSELDIDLEEVTKVILASLGEEERNKHKQVIMQKYIESITDKKETAEKIDPIVDHDKVFNILDSSHKWRALKRLSKGIDELKEFITSIEAYKTEVIDLRNILAHVKVEVVDGKKIFKSKLAGYENFEFNDAKAIEVRNNLRKHAEILEKISQKYS